MVNYWQNHLNMEKLINQFLKKYEQGGFTQSGTGESHGGDDDVLMSAENVIGIFQTESSNKGYSKEEIEIWSNTLRYHLNEYRDHISSKFN